MIQDAEATRILPICTFQAHKDYLTRLLLSPDVKHLATCSADHTAKVWNLDPEYPPAKKAAQITAATKKATGSDSNESNGAFTSPNGTSSQLSHGDVQDSNDLFSNLVPGLSGPSHEPQLVFPVQPDGPPMDAKMGTLFLETTLSNHQRWVWDCAFSADSAYLVTVSSDHYARLWELSSGQIIRQYSGHHRGAVCVALNDYSEPR